MQWKYVLHPMLLDTPCYQATVACLIYLLGVAESDQVVGRVIAAVLHYVVQSNCFQAY